MKELVRRWGRTRFAAVTSLVWALPMAAWAGSVDLYPGPAPWAAFGLGVVLLAAWLVLVARLRTIEVEARPRRLDFTAMSAAEKRWNAVFAVCTIGVIGWLNGAATVDWGILAPKLAAGRPGPIALLVGLLAFLALALAGAVVSGRRSAAAFRARASGDVGVKPVL
jgi:hypothetical protein